MSVLYTLHTEAGYQQSKMLMTWVTFHALLHPIIHWQNNIESFYCVAASSFSVCFFNSDDTDSNKD